MREAIKAGVVFAIILAAACLLPLVFVGLASYNNVCESNPCVTTR
jgi:hypothetical protein